MPSASVQPSAPQPLGFGFERVRSEAVSSLAVGTPPKLAIRSDSDVYVFDGRAWKTLPPIPDASAQCELFFGRDNEPRLIGAIASPGNPARAYYKRFKAGRWQNEPSELGPFASGSAPLFGVLGFTDPEVVCRASEICLIKRVSGWSRVPAPPSALHVALSAGGAWTLEPGRVARLEGSGFVSFGPARAWRDPKSVWVDASGAPWIVDGSAIVVERAGAWSELAAPFPAPSAIWGRAVDDVWLVGDGGAAHFDGASWQSVPGVTGALAELAPVGDELWLAGAGGVYRGTRTH